MVELKGISKYFPAAGVTALEGASFDLRPGEIHALLGENGAGKSTLMQILAGYQRPGAGKILLDGEERRFAAPAEALAAGIGMVRQHPAMSAGFKVWEDCILGAEPRRALFLDRKKARRQVRELSDRWGFDLPLDRRTETLTVSQRQKAAVLALLLRDIRWLIFDEPTAVLSPGETGGLFRLFRLLRAGGKGVVLISHKLDETLALADRVTILRRGKTAATLPAAALSPEQAGALIFGPPAEAARSPGGGPVPGAAPARPPVLAVKGLAVEAPGRPFIRGLDLECAPGKILGIAGVRDSGLETLELALTGFLPPRAGRITLKGQDISGGGVRGFRRAGGAYLNADRTGSAAAPGLSIRDSLIIHAIDRAGRGLPGFLDRRFLDAWALGIMEKAGVRVSLRRRGDSLSGGMLQRLVLAREFAEEAPLLVLAEPGWGLDRQGREALHRRLRDYAGLGRGVLLFSTDVDELLSVCDEILVLRNGSFAASVPGGPGGAGMAGLREQIGRAMAGIGAAPVEKAGGEGTHG
jgi:simple sugar transport system ATP-binding protein